MYRRSRGSESRASRLAKSATLENYSRPERVYPPKKLFPWGPTTAEERWSLRRCVIFSWIVGDPAFASTISRLPIGQQSKRWAPPGNQCMERVSRCLNPNGARYCRSLMSGFRSRRTKFTMFRRSCRLSIGMADGSARGCAWSRKMLRSYSKNMCVGTDAGVDATDNWRRLG